MAGTLSFGPVTLSPGSYRFPVSGGHAVADTDTVIVMEIDRTVAGGLNSLTAAVSLAVAGFQSNDNGVTWRQLGGSSFQGGLTGDGPSPDTTAGFRCPVFPGTSRLVYGTVQVTGGPVAVAGTLTTS